MNHAVDFVTMPYRSLIFVNKSELVLGPQVFTASQLSCVALYRCQARQMNRAAIKLC
jgi:hypothetical protein